MTVYLVGAGPGDPGLLTLRGAEVLRGADVVVYDRLSVSSLLDLAPAAAERVNVGKRSGEATMQQADINELLVERGRMGQTVVRLKGGDPFVFARGGEEARALHEAGVPFEIVPGVSSAVAVPAYAGIPVTMRHSSTLFTVVTGHEDPEKVGEVDWEAVARLGGTVVVLMGVGRMASIVERLLKGGLSKDTPVAVVQWGTRPDQRTVRATLGTILREHLEPPATIVIGAVAAMNLTWFEDRPLFGRTVVVTRAADGAASLAAKLRSRGAEAIVVPTIHIGDPADGGEALRSAARTIRSYDWVVFTSANGAERFLRELRDTRQLGDVRVAAIGPATAEAVARFNVVADLVPEQYVAESLLSAFPSCGPEDQERALLPRAAVARDVLPEGLRAKGWHVDVVEAYRTTPVAIDADTRSQVLAADAITFTSSSTVKAFVDSVGVAGCPDVVACIGPITAESARTHGLEVDVVATEHTLDGLVDSMEVYFAGRAAR